MVKAKEVTRFEFEAALRAAGVDRAEARRQARASRTNGTYLTVGRQIIRVKRANTYYQRKKEQTR